MASNNRATQINKVLKFAKKHFKPAVIAPDRTVLEHLVFACCAENSLLNSAREVYDALAADYYDWNEVRVTSIRELTDLMKPLNDPKEAATRLKRVLQSVFETHYSFDLEPMKKQNLGQAVKQLEKYNGTTHFTVAFVNQNALGGHSIPVNRGLLESMRVVSVISDGEAAKGSIPGLERVVPKSKGVEVGTILHQLGVELYRSPYGPTIRKFLLEIDPGCKDRLPKRPSKKVEPPLVKEAVPEEATKEKPGAADTKAKQKARTDAQPTKKVATKKQAANAAGGAVKKPAKQAAKQAVRKKKPVKKATAVKKLTSAKKTTPKTTTAKKGAAVKKKSITKKKGGKAPAKGKKKSVTKKLSKRKPK